MIKPKTLGTSAAGKTGGGVVLTVLRAKSRPGPAVVRVRNARSDQRQKDAKAFETIARRQPALPESRQSIGARRAAFARFIRVPILPGMDPLTHDRAQEQRVPTTRPLALDKADGGRAMASRGYSRWILR